jgi:alpha,alpha-trehalase
MYVIDIQRKSMKNWIPFLFFLFVCNKNQAQEVYLPAPNELYGQLFIDVQMAHIFPDSKTFADCEARMDPGMIINEYESADKSTLDLKQFVTDHFRLPAEVPAFNYIKQEEDLSRHIGNVWTILTRDVSGAYDGKTSLLEMPYAYVIPGGTKREIHYMDSYFTMLGLKESRQDEVIQNMVDIFTDAINRYGFIPSSFRTYSLSRSQTPFYSMMIEMLAELKGEAVLVKYLPAMEKEYAYWMEGSKDLKPGQAYKRVVRMKDGTYLNRYWDDLDIPRAENYLEDVEHVEKMTNVILRNLNLKSESEKIKIADSIRKSIFRNIRAASSCGWDTEGRWCSEDNNSGSYETTDIIPVDLNAMLLNLEIVILKARKIRGDKQTTNGIATRADFNVFFWNEKIGFYTDFQMKKYKKRSLISLAGMFPFCFEIGNVKDRQMKAKTASLVLKDKLLKPGGLIAEDKMNVKTSNNLGGWAPLQWMSVVGLERNGQSALANEIRERWLSTNEKVYQRTGKILEWYDVENINTEGLKKDKGYDAFGSTNGVYLALKKN